MTREEALQNLDEKFITRLTNRQQNAVDAELAYQSVVSAKEERRQKINEYYDALAEKDRIDAIVLQGEPAVT